MSKINAGVVVVNQFCKNNSKLFSGYINYMERDEAVRSKNTVEFNIYNDIWEIQKKPPDYLLI